MKFEKVSFEAFKHDSIKCGFAEETIKDAYESIRIPERKTAFSAGYDFVTPYTFKMGPHQKVSVPSGIKCYFSEREAEKNHLEIYVRSSTGIKKGIVLSNGTGIIDGDFYGSGEGDGGILIPLYNTSDQERNFEAGERIVQGILARHAYTEHDDVKTKRIGGIGSTNQPQKTIEEYIEESVDVEGYNGKYKVTNDGHVISMWRMTNNGTGITKIKKPIILKTSPDKNGYHYVSLCDGYGNPRAVGVHRLVAKAFIPNPDNKRNVCHKDNNPSNNNVENLYWGSNQENIRQSVRDGLHGLEQKVMQIDLDGNVVALYGSVTEAGKATGIERKNITRVLCGNRNKAGGYVWKRADDEDWEMWDTRNGEKPEKYNRRKWHRSKEYVCTDDGESIPEYHVTFDTTNFSVVQQIEDFFESLMV